jgi:CysZ protein
MQKKSSFFEQFKISITSYGKAITLVTDNGWWLYIIYPLIIAIGLYFGFSVLMSHLAVLFETWVWSFFSIESSSSLSHFLTGSLHFFISIGFAIISYLIFSTIIKYVLLIFMSPMMAILSEKTEKKLTGKEYVFNTKQFLKDLFRSLRMVMRNMAIELGITILFTLLVWIPIIGWLSPLFLLLLSFYFYGFSMMDYVNERRKYSVRESVQYVRANKGIAIGNGFIFCLLFAIPIIGAVLVALFAPVAACIAMIEAEGKNVAYEKN